ncbi:hypothetical protein BDK51DRAFT_26170 [Blyttiomyces helicus]|uniref:Uncharacterized protein n=1 Tax=Blyttiomyces helicus TaxID=388810 RepID=A0A4P9WCT4_9FUNG|nr:hypothetical protein BDK51DRAFT_26170 [Blyttiomyces helicus]|eukprot:RKO89423.1 hypothetical protein BDK51DRAFT_26170 [Blyttiomyces helicus]
MTTARQTIKELHSERMCGIKLVKYCQENGMKKRTGFAVNATAIWLAIEMVHRMDIPPAMLHFNFGTIKWAPMLDGKEGGRQYSKVGDWQINGNGKPYWQLSSTTTRPRIFGAQKIALIISTAGRKGRIGRKEDSASRCQQIGVGFQSDLIIYINTLQLPLLIQRQDHTIMVPAGNKQIPSW